MFEISKAEIKLLIIEDNPHDVYFLRLNLENEKSIVYDLTVCQTLKSALELLEKNELFDLAMIDLNLPDSQGIESLEAVMNIVPDLPCVVMTSHAHRDLVRDAMVRGAQEVISKEDLANRPISHVISNSIERQRLRQSLVDAEEKARQHSQFKTEFLAQFSHEIRTPLNGVIGMTSLLLETNLDAEQRDIAGTLQRSGETLLSLINDILDLSKIEAGKLEMNPRDFNIRDLIEEVLDLHAEGAIRKNLILGNIVSPSVPSIICADPVRVRQILNNLIGNAVKFTASGSVQVHVNFKGGSKGQFLICQVIDTGRGIAQDKLDLMFKPFSQINATDNETLKGTGLGLAICKQLVTLMNGEIGVKSVEGRGSCFTFSINAPEIPTPDNLRSPLDTLSCIIVTTNNHFLELVSAQLALRGIKTAHFLDLPSASDHGMKVPANSTCFVIFDALTLSSHALETQLKTMTQSPQLASSPTIIVTAPQLPLSKPVHDLISARSNFPLRQIDLYRLIGRIIFEDPTGKLREQTKHIASGQNLRMMKPLHVLVVDDSPVNLKVAEKALKRIGCDISLACDGVEAVEKSRHGTYDLILMDYKMPRLDGLEATKIIRSSAGPNQSTIIAALTANAFVEDRQRCIEAGMDDFLAKPVTINDLRSLIERNFGSFSQSSAESPMTAKDIDQNDLDERTLNDLKSLNDPNDDVPFLDDLIDTFVGLAPEIMTDLEMAIGRQSSRDTEKIAHKLKGMARNLGARSMADLCEEVEKNASTMELATAVSLFEQIKLAFNRCQSQLQSQWREIAA